MVEVKIEDRSKQVNSNNITYIISKNTEIRFRGYIMVSVSFVLTILPSLVILPNPFTIGFSCFVGIIVSYLLFRKMRGRNISSFGTVNESYDLPTSQINKLRSAFEESNSDRLNISGSQKTIFNNMNYGYHINPKNVVSMDRIDRSIPKYMSVGFLILSVIIISYMALTAEGIERISGVTVGLMLMIVTTIFTISNRPDLIEIEFTNDQKKKMVLSSDKCEDVVQYFNGDKELEEVAGRLSDTKEEESIPELEEDDLESLES